MAYVECRRSFWESFADFLLWPAENLLQIVDYVLDAVRWAVTWISWLAGALTMLIFVVDVIALVVTGGAGSIAAILSAPVFVVLGAITLVGRGSAPALLHQHGNRVVADNYSWLAGQVLWRWLA